MDCSSNRDLFAACLWAGATVVAVSFSDSILVRTVLGAPLALIISGHIVLRGIGIRTASVAEHLAYAVGASLAAGIAGGFALNAAGYLTPLGWTVWFCAVAAGGTLVAVGRRGAADLPAWPRPARIRLWQGAALTLALMVATGTYVLAVRDDGFAQFKYTEFWMLPRSHGDPGRLVVGIRSGENRTQQFDLEVTLDRQPFAVFRSLTIAPGDTWTREIAVPLLATQQKAEARLYRPDDNRLYRRASTLVPHS
jgi:hypothetical protein